MTIFVIVGVVIVYSFLLGILSNFPAAELGGAVFADVTSANVVGYNTLNKGEGVKYTMIGNNFKDVGGATGVKMSDLKGDFKDGDQIQVVYMTGVGIKIDFRIYTYVVDDAWVYDSDFPVWVDTLTDSVVKDSDIIAYAKAVYLITKGNDAEDVTMSGEVNGVAYTHTLDAMYSMITPASPVAFNPMDARYDWSLPDSTQIQTVFMTGDGIKIDFRIYNYIVDDAWAYDSDCPVWVNTLTDSVVTAPITDAGEGFYLILPASANPTEYGCVEQSVITK